MRLNLDDSYRHKGLRKEMVAALKEKGISDDMVLQVINDIPRHFFLDTAYDSYAYEIRAFPITADQTLSNPYTVAFQTSLLDIKPFHKVLEVGTGSGYQASVLAALKAFVYTIERQKELYDETIKQFPLKAKYPNIKFFFGDGFKGLPTYAPFDKVIITAAAPIIPPDLLSQLKIGGQMVIPVNMEDATKQQMKRITKISETEINEELFGEFQFVPMLSGVNKSYN
jgi:protein-L-isoaspartate(D-aspartate) O-methyltransferase